MSIWHIPARGRAALLASAAFVLLLGSAQAQQDTLSSVRSSEINLRSSIEQQPSNPSLRIALAKVYLKLGNPNAAVAELIVARQLRAKDELVAPLMAQAMVQNGDFANLLRTVPEGNRPAAVESSVRTFRGLAQIAIGETDNARASLQAAERLDPRNVAPKLAIARMMLGQRQYQQASQKIDEALAIAPNDSAALDEKGLAREYLGDGNAAFGYFNSAISHNPRNTDALLDRASLEISRNQLEPAAKDIAAAKALAPNSAMGIYLDAIVKARIGKYQDADAALNKIRPLMDSVPDAYLVAGEVKFKLNQTALAEDYFQKYIAHRQDNAQAYVMLGVIAMQRGDLDRAIAMLEKAHALAPQDSNAVVMLAQAYLSHGERDKALPLIDKERALQPNNPNVEAESALTHFAFGDPGASAQQLAALFKNGNGDLKVGPSLILAQMRAGKADDAANTAQMLVRRDPSNVLYQELFAAARVSQHNYPAAEGILSAILAKQPSLNAARESLAQVYVSEGHPNQAVKLYLDWIAKNPKDVKAKQSLAKIYIQRKDEASAVKLLQDASAAATDPDAGIQLAVIYERQHKLPDAIGVMTGLQTRFPNNLVVMDTLGRLYSESGDGKSSAAVYAKAAAAFPQSVGVWNDYATALGASGNYPAALDAMGKAHALAPNDQRIERGVIYLTYKAKGVQAAVAAGQSFEGNTPQSPTGILLAAEIIAKDGKTADAISVLQAAQAKTPSASGAVLLGGYLAGSGQMPAAKKTLEDWTKLHPKDYEPSFALAQLYGASGDYQNALHQFEALATQRPDDAIVLNNLAWLYSQKGDSRARATAEKAYKAAPQSAPVADTLGWIVANQGDASGALKYLKQACAESPNDPSMQYHLAFVYAKTDQTADAKQILQKVVASGANASVKNDAKQLLAKLGG